MRGSSAAVFCIIASEFCERFSFCGLRTILSLYLRNVLCLHENAATVVYHIFIMTCYTMPLLGAALADNYIGRYRVILYFLVVYLAGTILTCCATVPPLQLPPMSTSMVGLVLIAAGTGGIKPCVAAFGGDQFRLPDEREALQRFFTTFYCTVNLGGLAGMVAAPALRRGYMCFGDDTCYALGFALATALAAASIVVFLLGKPWYRIKEPRDSVTLQFVSCVWYGLRAKLSRRPCADPAPAHWLDPCVPRYGARLVDDMKVVLAILYLYLPVPIFWSLFDQQGSRWTFQASRLRSEVFGVNLMPDQLQVLNPLLVLLLIPVCPGGSCSPLGATAPLRRMCAGGVLAALAFVAAATLQLAIERSTLQPPPPQSTGLVLMNSLPCAVEVDVGGEGVLPLGGFDSALMTPLLWRPLQLTVRCPPKCAGRVMMVNNITHELKTVEQMFMPIVIGQTSEDGLAMYFMDPNAFTKSFTGKPKLKVVYIGDTGPDKNVSITVETSRRLSDIYYVSEAPVDRVGESAFMCLQHGKFRWSIESADVSLSGGGEGRVRTGGVYCLVLRERRGRLDGAALHAPNPPNELHLAWILPQYALVSLSEILFAVSGLEFSFTQAPKSMKTITIAAWYVSVAVGNLIVILVAQAKIFETRSTEFLVYALVLLLAMAAFHRMAMSFDSRAVDDDSTESQPLLHAKVISVQSLAASSSRPGGGGGGGGGGRRALTGAWPARARVHLATPPTSQERHATTLAQD